MRLVVLARVCACPWMSRCGGFSLREVLGYLRGEVGVRNICDWVSLEVVEAVSGSGHGNNCGG